MVNIQSLDLNLLKVFDALLEERHVSRAAKRVGLSQPAMSNALGRLRAIFDDPLFIRSGPVMLPTSRAQQLGEPLRAGLHQIRVALEGELAFDPLSSTRAFRISMPDYLEYRLAPALLRLFAREAPNVRLQVRRLDGLFQAPEGALRLGTIDAAVGFFSDTRNAEPGTEFETLFADPQAVIGCKNHPLLKSKLTIERFAEADHAAVIFRDEGWGLIDNELASRGLQRKLRFASPHFLTVIRAVQETELIACVPMWLARHFQSTGLTIRQPPFQLPDFVARLIWNRNVESDAGHRWFRQTASRTFVSADDGIS